MSLDLPTKRRRARDIRTGDLIRTGRRWGTVLNVRHDYTPGTGDSVTLLIHYLDDEHGIVTQEHFPAKAKIERATKLTPGDREIRGGDRHFVCDD